jgi:hypothetical protein
MDDDPLDYPRLVRDALVGVARNALRVAAERGLPGEHHFYLSFRTGDHGVALSKHLRTQYPQEMTIVLQHQYWDLEVSDEAFSVSLRFGGSVERVTVPFAALSGFADPAAPFGLRFDAAASSSPAGEKDAGRDETGLPDRGEAGSPRTEANVVDIAAFRKP